LVAEVQRRPDPDKPARWHSCVLSALIHPDRHAVLDAVFAAFTSDESGHALYIDLLRATLPDPGSEYLEHLMTTAAHQYKTDFADIAYARGEARGEANALLAVLTARGIAVPADIRTRITSCTDTEQLADWLVKAATATTATEVFG